MPDPAPVTHPRPHIAFAPIVLWLGLQMLALLAAGFRVPFSARFAPPEEQFALHEMFAVQMLASALLFPLLFRTVATSLILIATTPLMVQLAGVLAARAEMGTLIAACAYSTLWLIGLALWAYVFRNSTKAQTYAIAAATLLVVGGVLAAYLAREFGAPGEQLDWSRRGWLGPLMGGFALLESGARSGTAWAFMGFHLLTAGVAAGAHRRLGLSNPKTV